MGRDLDKAPAVVRKTALVITTANFDSLPESTDTIRYANFLYRAAGDDLRALVAQVLSGDLSVSTERVYGVDEYTQALDLSRSGRAGGKLLIDFTK